VRHAVLVHNSSPKHGSKSPFELFTGEQPPWSLNDLRTFGSQVYVLNKKLQDGDSFHKWRARCWQGVYIGHSNGHASNVPLVYNHQTTHVSPQFHLVHDENFSSIDSDDLQQCESFLQHIYQLGCSRHLQTTTLPLTTILILFGLLQTLIQLPWIPAPLSDYAARHPREIPW
jgi:hypothetical protein